MDELTKTEYHKRLRIGKQTNADREYQTRMRYERALRGNISALNRISKFSHPNKAYWNEQKITECKFSSPVKKRLHIPAQTDVYIEVCESLKEQDAECQTDSFLDCPCIPFLVHAKTGIDVATQIEEGELFDFEAEVVPILDTFVTYILEQSLLEVIQEEELAEMREQQRRFKELSICELAEKQQLAEQDRKCFEKREQYISKQAEMASNINGKAFSRKYIVDVVPTLFFELEEQDIIFDTEQDTEVFWPCLMNKVNEEITSLSKSFHLLDSLIKETVEIKLQCEDATEDCHTPEDISFNE